MSPEPFRTATGTGRLVVSMPHVGCHIPADILSQLIPVVWASSDTDWHVDRLYDLSENSDASLIAANWSRWVIDLNRPPGGESLYPGLATTGLCPLESFSGQRLYADGGEPDVVEIERRMALCWRPYHRQLRMLLDTARQMHGTVRLLDAHSITSQCPRLFEGRLPDINIGTNDGQSCTKRLREQIEEILAAQSRFSWVVDGRFKGGYITRHYGMPDYGIEAVQIELAQAAYMDEAHPRNWDRSRAEPMRQLLHRILAVLND